MYKRIISIVLIATLITPVFAFASIQNKIDEAFNRFGFRSTGTTPGFYSAQTHGIVTGGSLTMRGDTGTPIWFASVQPPKVKAGCGGIDMFFGGITIPSHQQFVQMLKSIGTGVLGYAFKMALKVVCSTCANVLDQIESAARFLNKLQTDSCYAARAITGYAFANLGESAVQSCFDHKKGEDGGFLHEVDAYQQCGDADVAKTYTVQKGREVLDAADPSTKVDVKQFKCGVSLWDGLKWAQGLGNDEKLLIMNLIGTYVRDKSGEVKWVSSTIDPIDFIYGVNVAGGKTVRLHSVAIDSTTGCLEIAPNQEIITVEGFKPKIKRQIDIISQKVRNRTPLNSVDQEFLNASPLPIYAMAKETQNFPAVFDVYSDLMSDLNAYLMSAVVIQRYVAAAEQAAAEQKQVPAKDMFEAVTKARERINMEMKSHLSVIEAHKTVYDLSVFYISQIRKVSEQLLATTTRKK